MTQDGRHYSVRDLEMDRRHPQPGHPHRSKGWSQRDAVTGSAAQVVRQLQDLLGLSFTGFNFIISGPHRMAAMNRIAEDVLPVLRSTE